MDFAFKSTLNPKKGRILLSDPFASDDLFERSVIYLCEHNEDESFGFILNKFLEINLQDIKQDLPDLMVNLILGGPVETSSIFYMHRKHEQLNCNFSNNIKKDIYFGSNFEQLFTPENIELILNDDVLLFLGYSGWSKGQLDAEMAQNSWVVCECDGWDEIIDNIENLWSFYMHKLGGKFKFYAESPSDPNLN